MNLPATAPNAKVHRRRGAVRGRAALKSVRAIPNPRPADRSPKTLKAEDRRPRAEIRRPKPEAERGSVFGLRPSTFGLLSAFDLRPSDLTRLRSSDFRAAEHDLPSTGRTLKQPWVRAAALALALVMLTPLAGAQDTNASRRLPRYRFRSGEATLRALAPVSEATRDSIVKFNVNGATVALGTIVASNGLALTKASELKPGKLTCWLATDKQVSAELIGVDADEDLALVRVNARGLKPIQWATDEVAIGQWAITPGIAETPQAVGIISALPRRIRPPRALIGVNFDYRNPTPRIDSILPGLGAEKAGLKAGDTIVAVSTMAVTNREQLVEAIRDYREGQVIKLRVQRLETQFTVDVRLMIPRAGQMDDTASAQPRLRSLTGAVSERSEGFEQAIEHDTVLQPWLCGGPLVNLDGKAIGINIARASRVTTYALPSRLAKRIFDDLKARSRISKQIGK